MHINTKFLYADTVEILFYFIKSNPILPVNWETQLFFLNWECIEKFVKQHFFFKGEKKKNRKKEKIECIEKKIQPKSSFESGKWNFWVQNQEWNLKFKCHFGTPFISFNCFQPFCIGATIRTRQEIQCLPCAEFIYSGL